jgi:hypothetical protein
LKSEAAFSITVKTMGGRKTKTTSTNTYSQIAPQTTQAQTNAESAAQRLRTMIDPTIRKYYGDAERALDESFNNPLGAYTTAAVRDNSLRAAKFDLNQAKAEALAGAEYSAGQGDFANQMALAQLTQPRIVQTGGTQVQQQSGGLLQGIIGGAAQVGAAAFM